MFTNTPLYLSKPPQSDLPSFFPEHLTCAALPTYSLMIPSVLVTPNQNPNILTSAASNSAFCLFSMLRSLNHTTLQVWPNFVHLSLHSCWNSLFVCFRLNRGSCMHMRHFSLFGNEQTAKELTLICANVTPFLYPLLIHILFCFPSNRHCFLIDLIRTRHPS